MTTLRCLYIASIFIFLKFNTCQSTAQTASDKKLGGVYTLELQNGTYLTLMQENIPIDTLFKNDRDGRLLDWLVESEDTFAYIYDDTRHVEYRRVYFKGKNNMEHIDDFDLFYESKGNPWFASYVILLTAKFKDKNTLVVWDKYKKKQEEVSLPEIKRIMGSF